MSPKSPAGGRDNSLVVYRALRSDILNGLIPAGSPVSQVQLAKRFGVSRGPVREALRLLQQEGLVEAEVNHRTRIARVSHEVIEGIYSQRIVLEALSIGMTVPKLTEEELDRLRTLTEEMDRLTGVDVELWTEAHTEYHQLLVSHSGPHLIDTVQSLSQLSERYRRIFMSESPRVWGSSIAEHQEILEACVARDARLASIRLARHLARTAITVLTLVAPETEPTLVRFAVKQVVGPDDNVDLRIQTSDGMVAS